MFIFTFSWWLRRQNIFFKCWFFFFFFCFATCLSGKGMALWLDEWFAGFLCLCFYFSLLYIVEVLSIPVCLASSFYPVLEATSSLWWLLPGQRLLHVLLITLVRSWDCFLCCWVRFQKALPVPILKNFLYIVFLLWLVSSESYMEIYNLRIMPLVPFLSAWKSSFLALFVDKTVFLPMHFFFLSDN